MNTGNTYTQTWVELPRADAGKHSDSKMQRGGCDQPEEAVRLGNWRTNEEEPDMPGRQTVLFLILSGRS